MAASLYTNPLVPQRVSTAYLVKKPPVKLTVGDCRTAIFRTSVLSVVKRQICIVGRAESSSSGEMELVAEVEADVPSIRTPVVDPKAIALFVEPSPFALIDEENFGEVAQVHACAVETSAAHVTAANKIGLWSKGVDSESFHPRYQSEEMRIRLTSGEPQKPLMIHVGRLGVEKSLDFLKRVMDQLPNARIAFVGDGPYRLELEKMFSGMPAVFTRMLHGEELSQAYASGDVFVMPSESETLGFVVLESMSSGVPVVAARAGGIPDIFPEDQGGKIGYLFTPGDLEDCVNKVQTLLSNEEL